MPKLQSSLFQVGQLAESRSSIPGFRGAWFRCEIKDVRWIKGQIKYCVAYYDYDDGGVEWLKLYQGHPKSKRLLMLRPKYPPIYHESELPSINDITEVSVVVDGSWSIGDKVDWLKDECFWSGTVTEVLGNGCVKVDLPAQPVGEGGSYSARCVKLRPSLDWYPESGWRFPASVEGQKGHSRARLIQPVKQGLPSQSLANEVDEINQNAEATPRSSLDLNDSISSHNSESSLPLLSRVFNSKKAMNQSKDISSKEREQTHGVDMEVDMGGTTGKRSCSDSVSSTYVLDDLVRVPVVSSAEMQDHGNVPAKRSPANEAIPLNSTSWDTVESAIMDLDELVSRIKWLKQILKSEGPSTTVSKKWEILKHPAVSTPK